MNIGSTYSEKKVYRGIEYSDGLPLLASDLHEFSDTLANKSDYLLSSLIGSGIIKSLNLSISAEGIRLLTPAILNIEGDICVVGNSEGVQLAPLELLTDSGNSAETEGVICIVGWYQRITYSTKMKEFGGVNNSEIENDLLHKDLKIQVSTRHQFRWDVGVWRGANADLSNISNIPLILDTKDANGDTSGTTYSINYGDLVPVESIYRTTPPSSMGYVEGGSLYIIPLVHYVYNTTSGAITDAHEMAIRRVSGSAIIPSETQPKNNLYTGLVWYNPTTREFKTYIEGTGFVDSASKMGFLQYQSVHIIEATVQDSNVQIPINISQFQEGDILQVDYEGLTLILDDQYSINYDNKTIILKEFTTIPGDKVSFTVTKIVEATDITNITTTFVEHLATTGSNTVEGHVKLSDSINGGFDSSRGVAATPKAVYESTLIKDSSASLNYKFIVENGILYLEEV